MGNVDYHKTKVTSFRLSDEDKANIAFIKQYGDDITSDVAAIRYALQQIADRGRRKLARYQQQQEEVVSEEADKLMAITDQYMQDMA